MVPGKRFYWGGRAIISEHINRSGERGSINFKTLLGFLILAALVFAGFKIVPVYVENYQFQDAMQTEARFALSGWPKKSEDEIREDLWKEMHEQIPQFKEISSFNGISDEGILIENSAFKHLQFCEGKGLHFNPANR